MNKSTHIPLIALTLMLAACTASPAYKNPALSSEKRTADLLSRMTLEEKLGQLVCPLGWPMYEKSTEGELSYSEEYVKFISQQHGGMLWATFRADPWTRKTLENGLYPREAAIVYNKLQHYAVDSTRLGIPIILAEEAPHGHMAIGTTVFPTGIALASTWDRELLREVGLAVNRELCAVGARIGYGPVVDLAREPRWSRVEETFGEDVCLTTQMASAMVEGTSEGLEKQRGGVISTLKHFAAYGIPQGGHNGNPSYIGQRDLRENFYPAFKGAIDAGALSVMTSYNSIDGIPSTANASMLRSLLKKEWGFEGFVISDLVSIDGLMSDHRIASSLDQAAQLALKAGVDVDLGGNCFPLLKESVEKGLISTKMLDDAVSRVLKLKFELGLFDHPYVDPDSVESIVRRPEHGEVALRAARESVVLLENNGILPLSKDVKVAVIGPNADRAYNQLGDYTAPQPEENIITPLEGICEKIGPENVKYVRGCGIRDTQTQNIRQAVKAAAQSDVILAFVGGSSARDFGTQYKDTGAAVADASSISDMEAGEGFDRASLDLLGLQPELLKALKKTGKPLVVVYIEGRPLDKTWAKDNADALLTQFYPGQAGGQAIADVLFGDYNPAGRLPISVPRSVGQLPVYYNKLNPAGHDYVEMSAAPLYSFGYGLSYTTFSYDNMTCEILPDGKVKVSVEISNTGSRGGEEVVQLYVSDLVASVVRPRKQLRAFERVYIEAGASRTVEMILDADAFSLYNAEMEYLLEEGEFLVGAGPSSDNILLSQTIAL